MVHLLEQLPLSLIPLLVVSHSAQEYLHQSSAPCRLPMVSIQYRIEAINTRGWSNYPLCNADINFNITCYQKPTYIK